MPLPVPGSNGNLRQHIAQADVEVAFVVEHFQPCAQPADQIGGENVLHVLIDEPGLQRKIGIAGERGHDLHVLPAVAQEFQGIVGVGGTQVVAVEEGMAEVGGGRAAVVGQAGGDHFRGEGGLAGGVQG